MSAIELDNLKREVEVHTSLNHPHIVRLEQVYESSGSVHLVMEQLHGGELFGRIEQMQGLGEEEAARVSAQLLRALAYLHSRCITHLDIKPENVVYQEIGGEHVKLIDFGFATQFQHGEQLEKRYGSVQYVAPEVLAKKTYNEKVDVWSLGSVVYCMLLAAPLYNGGQAEVLEKNRAGLIDYAPGFATLSPGAQDFIRSLLTLEPNLRPSAQEALGHGWLQAHNREVVDDMLGGCLVGIEQQGHMHVAGMLDSRLADVIPSSPHLVGGASCNADSSSKPLNMEKVTLRLLSLGVTGLFVPALRGVATHRKEDGVPMSG